MNSALELLFGFAKAPTRPGPDPEIVNRITLVGANVRAGKLERRYSCSHHQRVWVGVGEAPTAISLAVGTLVLMAVLVPAVTAVRTPG